MILTVNSVNQLIFVMVKCGVLFEVRTEFLNIIYASFCFKWSIFTDSATVKRNTCYGSAGAWNDYAWTHQNCGSWTPATDLSGYTECQPLCARFIYTLAGLAHRQQVSLVFCMYDLRILIGEIS
jgi:hypothetical protein